MSKPTAAAKAAAFADMPPDHHEGITARSKHHIKAPAHIVLSFGGDYVTWCTGAPALRETPMYGAARCRQCVALLREFHEECGDPGGLST